MSNGVELFKKLSFGKKIRLSIIALIVGIMVLAPLVAAAGNPNPGVVPVNSNFHGKTYGDWSADWWKWALSIPADRNPLYDDGTGKFTTEAQSGDVWFLAGSWVGTKEINCKVPVEKAIFFPIINAECSRIEGNGETEEELRACANDLMNHVTVTKVTVDGRQLKDLDDYRVESDIFLFKLPKDNILGLHPGSSKSVSDGYWIMLKPLSAGKHKIHIYGKAVGVLPDGSDFVTEMTYNLDVQPVK
ncbi:hypothetical protein BGV40_14985 [Methanosarcina sp. Ant1]|nr:hypothetical protein BGV40_14985 [Methanosarcina sp. Ant1]